MAGNQDRSKERKRKKVMVEAKYPVQQEQENESPLIYRQKVRELFAEYVSDFDASDGKIKLKIDHTYRVAAFCDRIADSLSLTGADKDVAWLLGMLHDIGRFKQIREYGTFDDSVSIDHALASVQVLFDEGNIRSFIETEAYDEIIYTAIRYHNAFRLPETLSRRMQMFCDLIRDADKVDIFRVNTEIPLTVIYGQQAENAPFEEVTEEVMTDYIQQRCVLRAKKKNAVDHVAGHASLAFELVYPVSLQIACEQGYLKKLLLYPTQNEVAKQQFEKMRSVMQSYCAGRGVRLSFDGE